MTIRRIQNIAPLKARLKTLNEGNPMKTALLVIDVQVGITITYPSYRTKIQGLLKIHQAD